MKYVVELARALAMMPEVYRVDLLTRQICSPDVDWSYGEPTEMLSMGSYEESEDVGESSGAYIVRIPCGPRYFALKTLEFFSKESVWLLFLPIELRLLSSVAERVLDSHEFADSVIRDFCFFCNVGDQLPRLWFLYYRPFHLS